VISLFTKNSLQVLESMTFANTLFAFDFDGTLSRIVRVPAEAKMTAKTAALLERLSRLAVVAIVSGRSVEDLRGRLGFRPKYLVGNHGLESLRADSSALEKASKTCQQWEASLSGHDWLSGIEIEQKTYSLAIHYRRSRNRKGARRQIREAIKTLQLAPRLIEGKLVFNLVPPGSTHKGAAILDLLRHSRLTHAFYIGDDDTDEDVFGLPEGPGKIMTVRVGRKQSSQAEYYIEGQAQIDRLLERLVAYHETAKGVRNA